MNTKEFFQQLKPWSERKHRLLRKYLPPFSAKVALTTRDREIFCVDGFAGAAKYEDGRDGSPILIAKFSDICASWNNPVSLRLINVEPDKENEGIFDSLVAATSTWVERGVVENIRSEFDVAVPEILNRIGQRPALFFIDPFGPSQVFFDHVRPIFSRPQKITELIINFNTYGLNRIARAAISPNTNPKVAETDANLVSSILGSGDWMEKFQNLELSTEEGETALLHEYIRNIRRYDYEVVAYQIRESLTARPQYHFVYCTRHRDGIALMNDFLREEEDLLYSDHVEINLPLFADEASLSNVKEDRRATLKVAIELYLERNPIGTRGKIRSNLLPMNFGHWHSKEYNAVVQELLVDDILKADSGKKRINDTEILRYYPGR